MGHVRARPASSRLNRKCRGARGHPRVQPAAPPVAGATAGRGPPGRHKLRRGPRPDPTPCAGCTEREARTWVPPGAKRGRDLGNNRTWPRRPSGVSSRIAGATATMPAFSLRAAAQRSIARGRRRTPEGTSRTQSDSPDETAVLTARDSSLRSQRPRRFAVPPIAESPRELTRPPQSTRPKAVSSAGSACQRSGPIPGHGLARRSQRCPGPAPVVPSACSWPHTHETGVHPSQRAGDPPAP